MSNSGIPINIGSVSSSTNTLGFSVLTHIADLIVETKQRDQHLLAFVDRIFGESLTGRNRFILYSLYPSIDASRPVMTSELVNFMRYIQGEKVRRIEAYLTL